MVWDQTNRPIWLRYTVGVLTAVIAAGIRLQFLEILEFRATFLTFYPAVAIAALYGGLGAGLLTTVVSAALADYFWIEPVGHFTIANSADLISMAIFFASGTLISYLAEATYRAQTRAHKAEERSRLAAEREKAAVDLQQSESKYRELVQNANSVILRWKRDGTIAFFNEYSQKFFGYTAEEVIGKHVNLLIPSQESTGGDQTELIQDIVNHPERYANNINENILRDGSRVWMAWTNRPTFDQDGQVLEILAVGSDITERRRAEETLRQSRVDLDRAQTVAQIGSWRLDIGRNVLTWSDENHRIFGVLKGTPLTYETFLDIVHPDDRQYVDTQWEAGLRGEPYDIEHRILVGGQVKWVREKAFLEFDDAGELLGGFGITQDITERKRMEDELRKSRDDLEVRVLERTGELQVSNRALMEYAAKLERLNEELQDFAFVASHDLQEPLRKIQTFCDLTTKRCAHALDGTGKEYLDRVVNSASRMRQLLHDMLQFSIVAARPGPVQEIDLGRIVQEAADLFEEDLRQSGGLIEIQDMPAIEADETQMLRLFQNLIANGLKYRGDERPRIKVYGKIDHQGCCEIFVKDDGIGFDRQFAERIFKPFQRLHNRKEYEGTGMGLAICRKIVERHGGSIKAESEPGKGATFIIRLPVKQDRLEVI